MAIGLDVQVMLFREQFGRGEGIVVAVRPLEGVSRTPPPRRPGGLPERLEAGQHLVDLVRVNDAMSSGGSYDGICW